MKNSHFFSCFGIVLCSALFITACQSNSSMNTSVKGNGKLVSTEMQLEELHTINVSNQFYVEYTQSDETPAFRIETDGNIYPLLDITIEDGVLAIDIKKENNRPYNINPTKLNVTIHSKSLSGINKSGSGIFAIVSPVHFADLKVELSGSGSMEIREEAIFDHFTYRQSGSGMLFFLKKVTASKMDMQQSGSGSLRCNDQLISPTLSIEQNGSGNSKFTAPVSAESLSIKQSGSGSITFSENVSLKQLSFSQRGSGKSSIRGAIAKGDISISGSGSLDALQAHFDTLSCTIAGSGNISATVDNKLDCSISGSGKLKLKGSPEIKKSIAGSGSIVHVN